MSFRQLVSFILEDNRRRRIFMRKSTSFFGLLAGLFSHISIATGIYRLSHYFFCKRLGLISKFFYVLNIMLFGLDISPMSEIGPGLVICHLTGSIIHAKIGKNALLYGQNVFGGGTKENDKGWYGGPIAGDNITMYIGAKILDTVKVGNNVSVGAASLVLDDVPDNKVVAGAPARVIRENNG